MTPKIQPWVNAALSFVYPEVCQVCRNEHATAAEGFVGAGCWQRVRFLVPPFCERCGLPFEGEITTKFECQNCREMELHFVSARSAVLTNELMLDVIHRYKYLREMWFEPFLADLLVRGAGQVLSRANCDIIVPVPLHPARRREREFNQAERLAACLSRVTQIPLNTKLLKRVEPTLTQTLLTREQRAVNMRGAFAIQPGTRLSGEKVTVVDDVFTTGATTSACAKMLLKAGASEVRVWTVARGV